MAFTTDQIVDLVTTTQKELGKMRWTEIATDIQEHHMLPQILKRERITITSGYAIQRNLQTETSGAAKHTGLFGVDKVNVGETMKTAVVPWRHTTVNYAFERREIETNRTPARIVELVKTRRSDAMIDLADLMEGTGWSKPLDSSDELTPWGIPMFIVPDVSVPDGQFTSNVPAGFPDVAGLSPTTYTRWRNWAFQTENPTTTGYTKDVTIKRMRRSHRKTRFRSPVNYPTYARGKDRYVVYMGIASIESLEETGEKQNENLGKDVASMDDRIVFRRNPCEWVPFLDDDPTFPMYFINWSVFHVYFLEGEWMREEKPEKSPNQHTVFRVFIDNSWNMFLVNRRGCSVGTIS